MEQANQQQRLTRKEKRIQRQQNQKENKTYQEKLNFNLRPIEPLTNNQKITFAALNIAFVFFHSGFSFLG